jgi:type IV pilus assembly protein PilV
MPNTSFPRCQPRRPKGQRGSSLIEVLVAALLLAIGLLAMAGMQASALKFTKEAQFRSAASDLAGSYAEMAKSNLTGALATNYDYQLPYAAPVAAIAQPATCRDGVTVCTPAQIAIDDLASWREAARLALPGGSLFAVLVPAAPGVPATINLWVLWQGPQSDDVLDAATAQINTNCPAAIPNANRNLQCMPFKISL